MKNFFCTALAMNLIYVIPSQATTFRLQKNQTVSDLVYELKLRPLYGRDGKVQLVLEHNNLAKEKAKKLAIGYKIEIPDKFVTSTNAQVPFVEEPSEDVAVIPEVVAEPKASDLEIKTIAILRTGYFSYQGNSEQEGNFKAAGPWFSVGLAREWHDGRWTPQIGGEIRITCLDCAKERSLPPSYKVESSLLRSFSESFAAGFGVGVNRDFFIVGDNSSYKLVQGNIPKVFFSSIFKTGLWQFGGKLGTTFQSNLENDKRSKANPFGELAIMRNVDQEWNMGLQISHEERDLNNFAQSLFSIGILVRKSYE